MADKPLRIIPQVLGVVADGHEDVARIIEAARDRGADIQAAVDSYGPIMHQVKAAVGDLLLHRDNALADHSARHRAASEQLNRAAYMFDNTNEESAEALRLENL